MSVTAASYARLAAVFPGLQVTADPPRSGAGWVTARELAAGGAALDAFVAADTEQVTRDHGRPPRPDVAATLALHRYLWPACLLFTVPWFLHRRVPRLPVGAVSFHRATGRMTAHTRSFTCLPGDPAARSADARTVPTHAALRDELRTALAEHLAPVLEGFGPLLRRGPRALWGMATDEITEGLWYVGQLLGEEERAVAELRQLLPGGTPPYAGGAHFLHRAGADDPSVPARNRLTCCLFYTISPTDTCGTCPRTCDTDRIGRRASAA